MRSTYTKYHRGLACGFRIRARLYSDDLFRIFARSWPTVVFYPAR
jgi:hypothetical protein